MFQKSNPFPKSIFENVAYGLRINHMTRSRAELSGRVETSLEGGGALGRGEGPASHLALALSEDSSSGCASRGRSPSSSRFLLEDEPASALDPIATQKIEELIYQLKSRHTIVIVTHNTQQAARVSDVTAFFCSTAGRVRPDGEDVHGTVQRS